MSSGPVLMISILVAFSVQVEVTLVAGQSPTATAAAPTPSNNATSVTATVNKTPTPTPSATTGASSTSVTPTVSSSEKTCGSVKVTLKTPNGGMNKTNDDFKKAIESFFDDLQKYKDVQVPELKVGEPKEGTFELTFKLCVTYITTDGFIEDVLLQQVKDGKLLNISIADGENSFTFKVAGVKFSDWEAKDGECEKCSDGGGGPIVIERTCEPEPNSCKGLKNTKKVNECVKFCNAVSIMISTLVVAMGIALSLSYNIWE